MVVSRRFPPIWPPLRPIAAMTREISESDTAALFARFLGAIGIEDSGTSVPVDCLTIWNAAWFTSEGRAVLLLRFSIGIVCHETRRAATSAYKKNRSARISQIGFPHEAGPLTEGLVQEHRTPGFSSPNVVSGWDAPGNRRIQFPHLLRNHTMGTVRLLPAVQLGCLMHGDPLMPCCIFLPPQTPSSTFADQLNQPKGIWTATFLCLRHGTVCVRHSGQVLPEFAPAGSNHHLWEIECVCGHENCGMRHTIYTGGVENPAQIKARILKLNPTVSCGSHKLAWKAEKVSLRRIL